MKKDWRIFFTPIIFILGSILPCHAGQWRDTFDGQRLDGWRSIAAGQDWDSSWKLEDGKLHVTMTVRDAFPWKTDLLQWTAHPIHTDSLTLVGEGLSLASLIYLFIGKRTAPPDFATGYIFSAGEARSRSFDKQGNITDGGKKRADYGDRMKFTRSQLKIVYAAGRFRVFTFDILLADFEDPQFRGINVVGFLVEAGGIDKQVQTSIDTFSISAPVIPDHNLDVAPQGKLATTWGELKSF